MAENLMFSGARTKLGSLVLAGAGLMPLAGCDGVGTPQQFPATSTQRADCFKEGTDAANAYQAILDGGKRTKADRLVDGVTGNNPQVKPNLDTAAAQIGLKREQECLTDARTANARAATEAVMSEKTSRPAAGGNVPPVAAEPSSNAPSADAASTSTPRAVAAPQYIPQASTDILKHESFGNADFEVLSKLIMLESGGGKNTSNPLNPKVEGIYQFSEGTARRFGLKDRADPFESLVAAGKLEVYNRKSLTQSLGRNPTKFEVAFAHQQGDVGAAALINNPEKNAIDVLTPIYKSKAVATQAIVNNSGDTSMTSEDFIAIHQGKYNMADANKGLAAINEILAGKGLETIDATFANPFGTKLDKTPYGTLFSAIMGKPKSIGESKTAKTLGGFADRLINGTPAQQPSR